MTTLESICKEFTSKLNKLVKIQEAEGLKATVNWGLNLERKKVLIKNAETKRGKIKNSASSKASKFIRNAEDEEYRILQEGDFKADEVMRCARNKSIHLSEVVEKELIKSEACRVEVVKINAAIHNIEKMFGVVSKN